MLRLILILIASLFLAGYPVPAFAVNQTLINEFELNPASIDTGAEKVELYNPSNSGVIDVSGWIVKSTAGTAATIVIDDATTILPKGYLVVGRDSQWLDNTGEVIELWNNFGMLVDSVGPFSDEVNSGASWQRSPDGQDSWVFLNNTLGGANIGTMVSDSGFSLPLTPEDTIEPNPLSLANSSARITPEIQSSQNLTIAFINVGQGDSTLVILPNGKTLLIDGGDHENSGRVLATLQQHDLSHIDVVVATHPHADHIGGLTDVIKNVGVEQVIDSGQIHTTQIFEDFLDAIAEKQIPLKSVREGYSIDLDTTVKIDVLNPPAALPDGVDNEAQFNDNSVVLKLTYGQFSALLTGDIQETNEARLVSKNASAIDAEVLKAGHHGSRTSSSSSFLNAVTPKVAIISLGFGNSYGHPHQEALDRLSAAGIEQIFRTDVDGTITLTTNGSSGYSIVTESGRNAFDLPKPEIASWSLQ